LSERRIYLLSPRELSPETIAVTFAKTSRSPESFDEIAAALNDEKSARFHEKWVVGYGHASVAEHAVLHLAMEGVSRLAVESIESNRLASYTEKSTRYQKWDVDAFHMPTELEGNSLQAEYTQTCRLLFETYLSALEPVRRIVVDRTPARANETDEALDRRIRSQYVDACRFLLPAAALANVGTTANARVLEHLICKMLSHELQEVRDIGQHVKTVAQGEVPTLVKYADVVPYILETRHDFEDAAIVSSIAASGPSPISCQLVEYDTAGESRILAAALYESSHATFADAFRYVEHLDPAGRDALAQALLGKLKNHDIPVRQLEYCNYIFDLVMDQGAYAEFKRHRMMTQTPQFLTTQLGYSTPSLLADAGLSTTYDEAMRAASVVFEKLCAFSPHVAQYVVPNGFHRRVLAQFNLREAFAFCELRSAPNAHFSIRLVAERVAEEIRRVHPLLARYMRLPVETPAEVAQRHFASTDSRPH
jgi:thymidylate synthase ThyX